MQTANDSVCLFDHTSDGDGRGYDEQEIASVSVTECGQCVTSVPRDSVTLWPGTRCHAVTTVTGLRLGLQHLHSSHVRTVSSPDILHSSADLNTAAAINYRFMVP